MWSTIDFRQTNTKSCKTWSKQAPKGAQSWLDYCFCGNLTIVLTNRCLINHWNRKWLNLIKKKQTLAPFITIPLNGLNQTQLKYSNKYSIYFKIKKYLFSFLHYPALTKSYYTIRQMAKQKKMKQWKRTWAKWNHKRNIQYILSLRRLYGRMLELKTTLLYNIVDFWVANKLSPFHCYSKCRKEKYNS